VRATAGMAGQLLARGVGFAALAASVMLALLAGMSDWLLAGERRLFPVQYVRIEGDIRHLDEARLMRALSTGVSGGYFSLDIEAVEQRARSIAWVEDVQVERLWPDTVVVRLREQSAVALWSGGELVNARGERFAPAASTPMQGLPVIDAPPGSEAEMLQVMARLNHSLRGQGLKIAGLTRSRRQAWVLKLDSGLELHVGRQDPVVATERFLELLPKLGEDRVRRLARLDLRYPNGFAVVWRQDSAPAQAEPEGA